MGVTMYGTQSWDFREYVSIDLDDVFRLAPKSGR